MKKLISIGLFLLSALSLYGQSEDSRLIDAFGKFEGGAYAGAIQAFETIIAEGKVDDGRIKLYKGIAEYKINDFASSLSDLMILSRNGITEANLWIARIYAKQNNRGDAILFIESYLRKSTGPDIEIIKKDSVFRTLHNTTEWFDLWQHNWISDKQKMADEALYYSARGDFVKAHKVLENSFSEENAPGLLYSANSEIYEREGIIELALNEINSALIAGPANSNYLKQKANLLNQLGKFGESVAIYSRLLNDFAGDFDVRLLRANAAYSAKNFKLANSDIELYLKYIQSDEALFLSGKIYYASGQYLNALKAFNRLMNDKQPNAKLYRARGNTYLKTSMYDQAAYDLSMSLDLEPENTEANFNLGLAEYSRGNLKLACYYWNRAKSFGNLQALEYLSKYCKE